MKIYTKTGDGGMTSLFGGRRVSKSDLRVEAYGSVDELNSLLGVVRSAGPHAEIQKILNDMQARLFDLGADLATPEKTGDRIRRIDEADVALLESIIDSAESTLPPLRSFILPGGTPGAAALHQARSVCRRAERAVVRLAAADVSINSSVIRYLNRLSDLLFVLARKENHLAGLSDVEWKQE